MNISVIHADEWRGCHGLVDVGDAKHFRVAHGSNVFANDVSHINGMASFGAYATLRLGQFKGIRKHRFDYPLKETAFRFNHRHDSVCHALLNMLQKKPMQCYNFLKPFKILN